MTSSLLFDFISQVLTYNTLCSSLDSRGALVVIRAMRRIADSGRTVVATIHQPSAAGKCRMQHDCISNLTRILTTLLHSLRNV